MKPNHTLFFTLAMMALLGATGCSKPQVSFEIRHFQITQETSSYGGKTYDGKGEVVVTTPNCKNKSFLLLLKEKETVALNDNSKEINESNSSVVIVNGIGVIHTRHYVTSSEIEKGRGNEPTYDWAPIGWAELNEATVTFVK